MTGMLEEAISGFQLQSDNLPGPFRQRARAGLLVPRDAGRTCFACRLRRAIDLLDRTALRKLLLRHQGTSACTLWFWDQEAWKKWWERPG